MPIDHKHKPSSLSDVFASNAKIVWFCQECGNHFTRSGKLPSKRVRDINIHWPDGVTKVRKAGTIGCPVRGDMCFSCNRMWDKWCSEEVTP